MPQISEVAAQAVDRTERSLGPGVDGYEVIAVFEKSAHNLRVRFSGMVKPVNKLSIPIEIKIHQPETGGWHAENHPLLSPGFRFDGGWDWPFNVTQPMGRLRVFESREDLEQLLKEGGYVPVPGFRYHEQISPVEDCTASDSRPAERPRG
jgi:hypothetical protein